MEDELLTDRQAAEYLKLSEKWGWQTIQKWVKEGKLRAGRVGDHYRFKKQDLDDFVFAKR
jgi:excisionase family DNA binding protein